MALVVAARKGDPAAFARMVEHWNAHLRPFVHHVLAGEGSTDRALSAAYVRAYRALPRYRGERKPGLWLHRIAYLAATDELRRVRRDPARRRALADAGLSDSDGGISGTGHEPLEHPGFEEAPDPYGLAGEPAAPVEGDPGPPGAGVDPGGSAPSDPAPEPERREEPTTESAIIEARNLIALAGGTVPENPFPPGWRRLAPDQRALAVLVDMEEYSIADAASALDAEEGPATARLNAARRVLGRSRTGAVGLEPTDPQEQDTLVEAARAALAEVEIPAADPDFWSMLGRRLLAERDAPAAPSIDPMARLAKAHPAEPGFKPSKHLRPIPGDPGYDPVQGLAEQADWAKPPRKWGRAGLVAGGVVLVAVCVAAAIWVGTRSRIPDGSEAGRDLVDPIAEAMAVGPYRRIEAVVSEEDSSGRTTDHEVTMTLANDGSWVVSRTGAIDQTTYDATTGTVRRVAVVGAGEQSELVVADEHGLAAGPPDPSPALPAPLDEIQLVPSLFRLVGEERVPKTTVDGQRMWSLTRTLPTGDQGADERWRVLVDTETSLPVQVERTRAGQLIRRVQIGSWSTVTEVAGDTFAQPVPEGTEPTASSHDFITTELAAVPLLGRGEAVTPGWLPPGFGLEVVAVRADPPAGAPSTAGGQNPVDEDVVSLGFQRGPERITVSTRAAGSDRAAWSAPFDTTLDRPRERTLGDGRFNGARARAGIDMFGRAHLWLVSDDAVVTVAGDLTVDEAFRLASSLR